MVSANFSTWPEVLKWIKIQDQYIKITYTDSEIKSYSKTRSGVSIEQSISSICSSRTKKRFHCSKIFDFNAQPIGPKSYNPAMPK